MKAIIKFAASVTLAVSLAAGLTACGQPTANVGKTVTSGTADIGGAYTLINQNGQSVTEADALGKPQLIYFGFSYCPDICPTALQKMGAAQARIDPDGDKLNYIFISVDPERDTPESLKLYVTANGFPKNLTGLTGTTEQIETAKSAFKVYSQKVPTPDSAADYTVDHSDIIYLMDKNGNFTEFFFGKSTVPEMAARINLHLKTGN
ncbi:SCO family protein [Hellea balneolensis]|uniref:SCO family protein n=1 Tax=Hellea balneolensis TaxID=287478 RepID=UPI00042942EC|nr:SCO family protein [Hellea balneolensis]